MSQYVSRKLRPRFGNAQEEIDTSVWSPEVQTYTRLFYARYGRGPPGQTPWRMGRGLQAKFVDSTASATADGTNVDTDTFLTAAHTEIQKSTLR